MSTVAYEIVDVFTDRPFAGNPLAVVFGADELAGDQMRTLAREFNLSETVFVLPSAAGATYRTRIFTPETELPFAGHPSVGAAVTAVRRGRVMPGQIIQECGAGLLPITVTSDTATVTGGKPTLGAALPVPELLELVGLDADDFAGGSAGPAVAGCGLEFVILPVRRDALARAWAHPDRARALGVTGISVFAWAAAERTAYVRVFCPGVSVPEDAATGSAALGLGVWLVAHGWLPGEGTTAYTVHQGVEMHRPSLIECTVTATAGTATLATVSGHVVPVARGDIAIPPFIG
ncbi:phenazine biosynthesis protein PhzF [Actinoplanes sp. ATCC 53533]|uniref:PhzF family phenazine biosynthesis protein n=1 Tax=Actinoplanes sp. ATCC 53533 TaxID=1288362 RepID=UPI000F7B3507|nr:PhzF family phenazine biosynthesis protein [Actinoplanes sp. ATCC 53533]RSM70371.1 phenazine biosynthesis protein PhzF [Actinoplanes sp. ATCC 53533]